jgi:hypothetical protein
MGTKSIQVEKQQSRINIRVFQKRAILSQFWTIVKSFLPVNFKPFLACCDLSVIEMLHQKACCNFNEKRVLQQTCKLILVYCTSLVVAALC